MTGNSLHGIRACVFDAYGTLFDHASAVAKAGVSLGEAAGGQPAGRLSTLWREKQLQYTWLRGLQGRHADFRQVTGDALDFVMETMGIDDSALRRRLMDAYLTLEAFPEVRAMLTRLKKAGLKTAILSNGSPEMLHAVIEHNAIGGLLDLTLSVEDAGVFKPHPKVYRLAIERLGMDAEAMAFISANAWDAYAASAFGMRVVWCNRYGARRERLPGHPDREIKTLAALPEIVGA